MRALPFPARHLPAIGALLALLATAAPAHADDAVRGVLESDRYRFCHEKDYPLVRDEHAWCPIVGAKSAECPALPDACARPPVERRATAGGSSAGSSGGDGPPKGDRARRREKDAPEPGIVEDTRTRPPEPARLPDLSGFAKVLLVALVIAFVVAIARSLRRNFLEGRGEEAPADEPNAAPAPGEDGPAARGPVETDVDRLLERARSAAARGDFRRAIDDAYAALLRRLDGDGRIEIHPSRTNGDYVRALADDPELRGALREVARDVERVQFGDSAPTEPLYRAVLGRVLPLVGRASGAILIALALSGATSCASDGRRVTGHALRGDPSPSGTGAIVDLLGKEGVEIRYRGARLDAVEDPRTLVILPGARVERETWDHLLAWVRDKGGRLVIAGATPPPELGLAMADARERSTAVLVERAYWQAYDVASLEIPPGAELASRQGGDDEIPGLLLLRDGRPYAVLRREGKGEIAVFADDHLFTNIALTVPADATFLTRFLGKPEGGIEICDDRTGVGAATPIESIRRAELTPVIAQLLALLALLYLSRGRPFAALRDPPAQRRRAFADHARALGLSYARAQASRHVLGLYAAWAIERLRERVLGSGRQGLVPLAEAIAARTGRAEGEVMRVLVEAQGAREDVAPPSSLAPRGGHPSPASRARRDEAAADFALMRELSGFVSAPQARRRDRRSRKTS